MAQFALLFFVVSLVELWLLLALGGLIGFWPTVGISLASALLGGYLAKREGRRVFRQWSSALASGRVPDEGVASGLLMLVGGVLLIAPGILTDLTGLALLFPPTRRIVANIVRKRAATRIQESVQGGIGAAASSGWNVRVIRFDGGFPGGSGGYAGKRPSREDVIDVEGEVVEEQSTKRLMR